MDGLVQIYIVTGDIIFTIDDTSVKINNIQPDIEQALTVSQINSDDCGCYPQDRKDRRE